MELHPLTHECEQPSLLAALCACALLFNPRRFHTRTFHATGFSMAVDDGMCCKIDFEVSLVDGHFICISENSSDFFKR
jgi:hypothetical protein